MSKPICFVCNNPIKENPLYIGKGLYRHRQKCIPTGKSYAKFEVQQEDREHEERSYRHDERRDFVHSGHEEEINE